MRQFLIIAVAATAILAACGDDNKSSSSKSPSSQATPATGGVRPSGSPSAQASPAAKSSPSPAALSDGNAPGIPELRGEIKSDGGLRYIDEKAGDGASPITGQHVQVQYTGWLSTGGTPFDSSRTRNKPYDFVIGKGGVIKGWDIGVATMKIGGKRRLIIPADLGYGARGSGASIPPNSTLIFDVELLSVGP